MILHVDSVVMAIIIGIFSIGLIWLVARKATSSVPTKTQAFVELIFGFIDSQVSAIFHGNRHTFIAPAALTVFLGPNDECNGFPSYRYNVKILWFSWFT